jgi:hypothetical protein
MGAVAIAAPATNSPHGARCAFQQGYLCPRGCEAPWVTVEHHARQKRASARRWGVLVISLLPPLGAAWRRTKQHDQRFAVFRKIDPITRTSIDDVFADNIERNCGC